jgi:hypothetical protein
MNPFVCDLQYDTEADANFAAHMLVHCPACNYWVSDDALAYLYEYANISDIKRESQQTPEPHHGQHHSELPSVWKQAVLDTREVRSASCPSISTCRAC